MKPTIIMLIIRALYLLLTATSAPEQHKEKWLKDAKKEIDELKHQQ